MSLPLQSSPSRSAALPIVVPGRAAQHWYEYERGSTIPLLAFHVGAAIGIYQGGDLSVWGLFALLYFGRMFGITAGFHRYFAHRSYKTSRVMQFLLALLATSASQRGILWWVARHRQHHENADTVEDLHSPVRWGMGHAHIGWLYDRHDELEIDRVKDWASYPELRLLERYWRVPPLLLGVGCWMWMGLPGLLIGFMFSTVCLWHSSFAVASLSHVWGTRAFDTPDQSRNNALIALLTMGEGWHNNHHHYMTSARQGFRWWQVDLSYYGIRLLGALGLVWDIREPPHEMRRASTVRKTARRTPSPEL